MRRRVRYRPALLVAGDAEDFFLGFVPDVGTVADAVVGLEINLVVCQDAEGRNDVLPEILVLVIAPEQDEVGVEGVNFLAELAEGVKDLGPVGFVRGDALVVAPFGLHFGGPVGGILHVLGNPVGFEHPDQGPRLVFVGYQAGGIVSGANAKYFSHEILQLDRTLPIDSVLPDSGGFGNYRFRLAR